MISTIRHSIELLEEPVTRTKPLNGGQPKANTTKTTFYAPNQLLQRTLRVTDHLKPRVFEQEPVQG
jgi:hypothetical protein